MAITKTKNAIFEDDFANLLEFSFKKCEKISKDPPKSRFL